MKIWHGYGSEHSMNLVLIGSFKDVARAGEVKDILDKLTNQVKKEAEAGTLEIGQHSDRYTDATLDLLRELHLYILAPDEMEQFGYDFELKVENEKIVITTEESEFSAFLKVLIDKGARVELYSAHEYPGTAYGR